MKKLARYSFAFAVAMLLGCGTTTTKRNNLPPLQAVDSVDLKRYVGTWYEIANYPQRFQKGCHATTATYEQHDSGKIRVINRCNKGSLDGPVDEAKGWAKVTDKKSNAKLKVSFFRPFWGAYWVIQLHPEYEFAVVGHPSRDYLWILSRTPTMDDARYNAILEELEAVGYELDRIVKTEHPTQ